MYHQTSIAHVSPMAQVMIPQPFPLSLITICGPYNVTYTNDQNSKEKRRQILVIPFPYLSLTPSLARFQPQEP